MNEKNKSDKFLRLYGDLKHDMLIHNITRINNNDTYIKTMDADIDNHEIKLTVKLAEPFEEIIKKFQNKDPQVQQELKDSVLKFFGLKNKSNLVDFGIEAQYQQVIKLTYPDFFEELVDEKLMLIPNDYTKYYEEGNVILELKF